MWGNKEQLVSRREQLPLGLFPSYFLSQEDSHSHPLQCPAHLLCAWGWHLRARPGGTAPTSGLARGHDKVP